MEEANKSKSQVPPRTSVISAARTNFLTGLIIVAPVVLTIYLTWTLITFVDDTVVPWVPRVYNPRTYIEMDIPGFGLFIFLVVNIIVGYFTKNLFGRQLIRLVEGWVDRMPVVRTIYNSLKQIAETVISQGNASFQKVCLIEYPRRGAWSIAFVATATSGEVPEKLGEKNMLSIFVPTTPNPTSGYLLFLAEEEIVMLDMSVEEAAKLVISGGLVTPPTKEEREAAKKKQPQKPAEPATDAGS